MEQKDKYIAGKTKSGFSFRILRKALSNWELQEAWPEDVNNITARQADRVMELILGTEQYKKLREHVRDDDNIVDTEKMVSEITDIMSAISEDSEGKN